MLNICVIWYCHRQKDLTISCCSHLFKMMHVRVFILILVVFVCCDQTICEYVFIHITLLVTRSVSSFFVLSVFFKFKCTHKRKILVIWNLIDRPKGINQFHKKMTEYINKINRNAKPNVFMNLNAFPIIGIPVKSTLVSISSYYKTWLSSI